MLHVFMIFCPFLNSVRVVMVFVGVCLGNVDGYVFCIKQVVALLDICCMSYIQ